MANRFGAKRRAGGMGLLLPVLLLLALVLLFNMGLGGLSAASDAQAAQAAHTAVVRAVVMFYATQGRYPPSIDYLVEHHGLSIDRRRFVVHYDVFASNVMPQITVLPRGGAL